MKGGTRQPKSRRLFLTGSTIKPGTKEPLAVPRLRAWSSDQDPRIEHRREDMRQHLRGR